MTGFFTGLLLAAISGICFLAVQYPSLYRDHIFGRLNFVVISIYFLITAYNIGVSRASFIAIRLIPLDKQSLLQEGINNIKLPDLITILGFAGFLVFLVVLLWLSYLIEKERKLKRDDA